jgi:hypothetical protein
LKKSLKYGIIKAAWELPFLMPQRYLKRIIQGKGALKLPRIIQNWKGDSTMNIPRRLSA